MLSILIARHTIRVAPDDRLALRQPFALARRGLRPFLVAESLRHDPDIGIASEPVVKSFSNFRDEVMYCADEFSKFIAGGLQPEDLMAIAIDDKAAKSYLAALSEILATRGITSNNIIADRYSEPAFRGKVHAQYGLPS